MIGFEKYKDLGQNPMPSKDKERDYNWYLALVKHIAASQYNGMGLIPYNQGVYHGHCGEQYTVSHPHQKNCRRPFHVLRAYAKSCQDVGKYKQRITSEKDYQIGRTTHNISWEPPGIVQKYRDLVISNIIKQEIGPVLTTQNPMSVARKREEESFLKFKFMNETVKLQKETGIPITETISEKLGVKFTSQEDVDMYLNLGGIKVASELAGEAALTWSLDSSNYNDTLILDIVGDAVDVGYCIARAYHNQEGRVLFDRVEPERFIGPCSNYLDYRDIDYGGQVKSQTFRSIVEENGRDLDRKQLREIASLYNKGSLDIQDSQAIEIVELFFIDVKENIYTEKYYQNQMHFKKQDSDYKLKDKEKKKGKKIHKLKELFLHKVKWVVGTDIIYDYGIVEETPKWGKSGYKKVMIPYAIHRVPTGSLMSRVIGDIDDMCIATYKMRTEIARIPPGGGFWVDLNLLEDVLDDHEPLDILEAYFYTGAGVFRGKSEDGLPRQTPGVSKPVQKDGSSPEQNVQTFLSLISIALGRIENSFGLNQVVDGSTPNPKILKSVAEMAVLSSSNAMYPLFVTHKQMFKGLMERGIREWQIVLGQNDIDFEFFPFGSMAAKIISLTKELDFEDMGVDVDVMFTDQERQDLIATIASLKQKRDTTGSGGIDDATFLRIQMFIKKGMIKHATYIVSAMISDQERKDAERKQADIQMNAKVQQESAAAAAAGEKENIILKHKLEIDKDNNASRNKIRETIIIEKEKRKTAAGLQVQKGLQQAELAGLNSGVTTNQSS